MNECMYDDYHSFMDVHHCLHLLVGLGANFMSALDLINCPRADKEGNQERNKKKMLSVNGSNGGKQFHNVESPNHSSL